MSYAAEARLLGLSKDVLGPSTEAFAAAVYFAGRGFLSSMFSHVSMAIQQGRMHGSCEVLALR
eukprot:47823-Lingulodinium_polyedra.AAC.1